MPAENGDRRWCAGASRGRSGGGEPTSSRRPGARPTCAGRAVDVASQQPSPGHAAGREPALAACRARPAGARRATGATLSPPPGDRRRGEIETAASAGGNQSSGRPSPSGPARYRSAGVIVEDGREVRLFIECSLTAGTRCGSPPRSAPGPGLRPFWPIWPTARRRQAQPQARQPSAAPPRRLRRPRALGRTRRRRGRPDAPRVGKIVAVVKDERCRRCRRRLDGDDEVAPS